jgi:hypothetical protein
MSSDKPEQKSTGWIVTIAGMVITGMFGIITTAIANWEKLPFSESIESSVSSVPGQPATDSPTISSIPSSAEVLEDQKDTGEIEVHANDPRGTRFENRNSSRQTYEFTAVGSWTYNNKVQGLHGPNGIQGLNATDKYNLPGSPEGALVVRKEDGTYQFIGRYEELTLESGESIVFTINDEIEEDEPSRGYNDNDGTLTVAWNCRTCR